VREIIYRIPVGFVLFLKSLDFILNENKGSAPPWGDLSFGISPSIDSRSLTLDPLISTTGLFLHESR